MESLEAIFVILSILIMTASAAVISAAGKNKDMDGKLVLQSLLVSSITVLIIYYSPVLTLTIVLIILIIVASIESKKRDAKKEQFKP